MPLQTPQALTVLHTPVRHGGLGFLCNQRQAALHLLQAILPRVEEVPLAAAGDSPSAPLLAQALGYLEHQAGTPLRDKLLHLQPHRMGGRLRELFYKLEAHSCGTSAPGFSFRACLLRPLRSLRLRGCGKCRSTWHGTQPRVIISSPRHLCGSPCKSISDCRFSERANDAATLLL